MTRISLAGLLAAVLVSSAALAQASFADDPGAVTAHEVTGKRLLDGNGAALGWIEKADASQATVRAPDGKHFKIDLAKLSLGFGPHTVIAEGDGDADKLNAQEASSLK